MKPGEMKQILCNFVFLSLQQAQRYKHPKLHADINQGITAAVLKRQCTQASVSL